MEISLENTSKIFVGPTTKEPLQETKLNGRKFTVETGSKFSKRYNEIVTELIRLRENDSQDNVSEPGVEEKKLQKDRIAKQLQDRISIQIAELDVLFAPLWTKLTESLGNFTALAKDIQNIFWSGSAIQGEGMESLLKRAAFFDDLIVDSVETSSSSQGSSSPTFSQQLREKLPKLLEAYETRDYWKLPSSYQAKKPTKEESLKAAGTVETLVAEVNNLLSPRAEKLCRDQNEFADFCASSTECTRLTTASLLKTATRFDKLS